SCHSADLVSFPTRRSSDLRHVLVFFMIAAVAAPALRLHGAAQRPSASRGAFAMRVVTNGLANPFQVVWAPDDYLWVTERTAGRVDRKSTRLNSSHRTISYA